MKFRICFKRCSLLGETGQFEKVILHPTSCIYKFRECAKQCTGKAEGLSLLICIATPDLFPGMVAAQDILVPYKYQVANHREYGDL